jgi:GNAT superfamily N-acetyltransferase
MMIREARPGDEPALTKLRSILLESMLERPLTEEERRIVADYFQTWDWRDPYTLVAADEELAGTISCSFYHQLPSAWNPTGICANLHNLVVDPEHRRHGIARQLMGEILRECRKRRTGWISLYATEMGIELYQSLGFGEFKIPLPEMCLYYADLLEMEL